MAFTQREHNFCQIMANIVPVARLTISKRNQCIAKNDGAITAIHKKT